MSQKQTKTELTLTSSVDDALAELDAVVDIAPKDIQIKDLVLPRLKLVHATGNVGKIAKDEGISLGSIVLDDEAGGLTRCDDPVTFAPVHIKRGWEEAVKYGAGVMPRRLSTEDEVLAAGGTTVYDDAEDAAYFYRFLDTIGLMTAEAADNPFLGWPMVSDPKVKLVLVRATFRKSGFRYGGQPILSASIVRGRKLLPSFSMSSVEKEFKGNVYYVFRSRQLPDGVFAKEATLVAHRNNLISDPELGDKLEDVENTAIDDSDDVDYGPSKGKF